MCGPRTLPTTASMMPFEAWMGPHAIAVVQSVHDDYCFTWDHAGYHRDLYDIEGTYLAPGGAFWCLAADGRIVGCVGVSREGDACELHRMYLHRDCRGRGFGRMLLGTALDWGRANGFRRMIAWSDVKLGLAHHLYLASGFRVFGLRRCDDPDESLEHGFVKEPI